MATRLIDDPMCACAVIREAARAVTQFYDLVLEPCGLKSTQFIALKTISEAGELPQWQFARDHALAVETLSRRLGSLRKKGLIAVRTGKNHGEPNPGRLHRRVDTHSLNEPKQWRILLVIHLRYMQCRILLFACTQGDHH